MAADGGNNAIRKVTPEGFVSTLAGGTYGYFDGASAQFITPYGVAVDNGGYVYVAEFSNAAIRRISPTGFTETVAGHNLIGSLDGNGAVAQFNSPIALVVSPSGCLYVNDGEGRTIRKIQRVLDQGSLTGKTR